MKYFQRALAIFFIALAYVTVCGPLAFVIIGDMIASWRADDARVK